ncbi:hypothetical protein BGZ61DRAFT_575876 [Ilyonectria robusta]|uniref:uncharacterized protein n=1 Tax=Ilyonectria robusta TaxID=1079257 RepID=UPI001E8E5080|nr:uncharacterized protein BGZ61DRAFT_575876 [Ilyonectria robusta]KAH8706284.1 hypothetical protein BGZ61DRAFT_575876 [Ilyonectria robusta]
MENVKFRPGPIITGTVFDKYYRNFVITAKLPFVRWPGSDRMPYDYTSPQFKSKSEDAVDAFADELDEKLKGENFIQPLRLACLLLELHQLEVLIPVFALTRDQHQFYIYAAEAIKKLFISHNYLTLDCHIDLDPVSSDDGKSPQKDSGKKP